MGHVLWLEMEALLLQINPSKRPQTWRWTAQSSHGQSRVVGRGRRCDGTANIGKVGPHRGDARGISHGHEPCNEGLADRQRSRRGHVVGVRDHPEVHCLGYDELVEAGVQPDTLDVLGLRLFGHGGGTCQSTTTQTVRWTCRSNVWCGVGWAMGRLTQETRCVGMHVPTSAGIGRPKTAGGTSPHWGDTAKWHLRLDAPPELPLTAMETAQAFEGEVAETRTTHRARGVEETHDFNLIKSGRNWFGTRLSALGANVKAYNIPVASLWLGSRRKFVLRQPCARLAAARAQS